MKKSKTAGFLPVHSLVLIAGLYLTLTFTGSCVNKIFNTYPVALLPDTIYKWADWNVAFDNGADGLSRIQQEQFLKNYISVTIGDYNTAHGTNFIPTFSVFYCPCDSTLFNFSVTLINGSGTSAGSPPPPPPPPGGSGDNVEYVSLNNTLEMEIPMEGHNPDTASKPTVRFDSIDPSKILAVMDTGLDTAFFNRGISRLLWNSPSGNTIRNFMISTGTTTDFSYFFDDNKSKHGTAVTALALQSIFKSSRSLPRVMVLKVLDSASRGSSFTVSCALSYAVQNRATLVNASLGYYSRGVVDSVLRKYLLLCQEATPVPVKVLAAAGNLHGPHITAELCRTPATSQLNSSLLFYPACFNPTIPGIIAVNTLKDLSNGCYYQNFSNQYVDVGVLSKVNCCRFNVLGTGYEGSSFATPIVSGMMMGCILNSAGAVNPNCLEIISNTANSLLPFTKQGRYVSLPDNF